MNKQHKCTCGASLTSLCKDSKICPEMNNKTAEEIYLDTLYKDRGIPSNSPLANKWMGDFRKSLEYHDTIKAITVAMQLYSEQNTTLKKRIEELERVLSVVQGSLKTHGSYPSTVKLIDDLLNPSTNGKQD